MARSQASLGSGSKIVEGETSTFVGGDALASLEASTVKPEDILKPAVVVEGSFEEPKPGDRIAKKYRVLNDRNISAGSYRANLPAGKIITEAAYDIPNLVKQGVKLEEVTE